MSGKLLTRIALVLVVLLVAWGLLALLHRSGQDRQARLLLPKIEQPQVDSVVVYAGSDTIRLLKGSGDAWVVNGHPAAADVTKSLFDALGDTTHANELVAESAQSHQRLGVDSVAGRRLEVFGGGKLLLDLVTGGRGPDYDGTYVRRPAEAQVYLEHGHLPEVTSRKPDDWRDKRIGGIAPDSVTAVEVTRGHSHYGLKRGALWAFTDGKPVDTAAVGRLLEGFRAITASGFATPAQAESANFSKPGRKLRILGAAGPAIALTFDSTAGGFWARSDSGTVVYRLDQWIVDRLAPPDTVFRKK